MLMDINRASLGDWKKFKTSRTVIEIQIYNLFQSIHSGAFYYVKKKARDKAICFSSYHIDGILSNR
ncbi:hypothetical protein CN324_21550 [Bacillus anthracis]|nr:hypothetical protein CN372_16845 [Bacillus anthracis]PFF18140.1 hypothetical protein CN324_21550 [Bacillus anthracis]PGX27728.1 hypothetical protein COE33_16370 [Bacillus anthracis]